MKHLTDIGIYIVAHAKERDPLILGSSVARKLRLHSVDTESLLTAIYAAKHFGVDDVLKNEAVQVISKMPIYEKVNELLR